MEQISDTFIQQAGDYIAKAKNILLLSHKNPDGDALGSGLALYQYFKEKGVNANFILPNQLPDYLNWMPNVQKAITYNTQKELALEIINQADLIIMVDFNHQSRLDKMAEIVLESKAPKIMIDHHPNPEQISDLLYSRVSSSSTAEMVFEFIRAINKGEKLSKEIAECLFLGIVTDTGSFSYNSSNPFTFEVVCELLKSGIDKDFIIDKVYNNHSHSRLRLLGYSLNDNMVVLPEYSTAYIYLSKDDLEKYNFEPGDTEGFVNYPLSIKGIVFSAIFIEKDGFTKCSFRSKGTFPANKVSGDHFNGGGHLNAAGGESKASLKNTMDKFERILPDYSKYLDE